MTPWANLGSAAVLIGWSALIWFNSEQVAMGPARPYAGFWMAIALILVASAVTEMRTRRGGDAPPRGRSGFAWLIVILAVLGWLAPRWQTIPALFTEASYSVTLSASLAAALVALVAALVNRTRTPGAEWTGALPLVARGGAAVSIVLVGLSVWIHATTDHTDMGRYGPMRPGLFIVEHPIFWVVAIAAAFAARTTYTEHR